MARKIDSTPVTGNIDKLRRLSGGDELQIDHFASGETIFPENESGSRMYIVKEGEVEVLFRGQSIAVLKKDAVIGEMDAIEDDPPSPALYATTNCKLIVIDKELIHSQTDEQPDLGFRKEVMRVLHGRLGWRLKWIRFPEYEDERTLLGMARATDYFIRRVPDRDILLS